MGLHFFPRGDAEFVAWGNRFVEYLGSRFTAVGLGEPEWTQLKRSWDGFTAAYAQHIKTHAIAAAAFQEKARARADFEATLRPIVRRIQAHDGTTDEARAALGITVREGNRTRLPPPSTRPVVAIAEGTRLKHTLRYSDESTPNRRSKPRGVVGAELWMAVVPNGETRCPPLPPERDGGLEYLYVALSPRSPTTVDFDSAKAGQTACYVLRWINRRGAKGPWSEPARAVVTV